MAKLLPSALIRSQSDDYPEGTCMGMTMQLPSMTGIVIPRIFSINTLSIYWVSCGRRTDFEKIVTTGAGNDIERAYRTRQEKWCVSGEW